MKLIFLLSSFFLIPLSIQANSDHEVLTGLHADTWNCLDAMIDPMTGFPQDTQYPGGHTNTTNIGLYLASLCVAVEKKLASHEHGLNRTKKILNSLESLERPHGFTPHILDVQLRSKKATGYVAISDFNKLIVGLIMSKQIWPELSPRIDKFINAVQWEKLYHKDSGNVSWGYDFDKDQPLGDGHLWLPADTRSAAFLMIATGAAPPEMWADMDRTPLKTPYGKILRGYGMGGLFMMAMDSIFLDELGTEIGGSSGNFAWQQIQFSKKRGYPFWGWSNCYMPGKGYTEGGHLSEQVITPHALALMIEFYPKHVTQAFRELVKTGGTQGPQGYEHVSWGFRDAYDMKTKKWDHRYLSLDQGMLFLALSNYLHDGIVRKIYHSDPLVKRGMRLIAPYMQENPQLRELWAMRDAQISTTNHEPVEVSQTLIRKPRLTQNISSRHFTAKNLSDQSLAIQFQNHQSTEPQSIQFQIDETDFTNTKSLELDLELLGSSAKIPGSLRLMITDKFDQVRYAHFELQENQSTYKIKAEDLLGIHIDESSIKSLQLVFWTKPWYYQSFKLNSDKLHLKFSEVRINK
jgi:hypothetical protein